MQAGSEGHARSQTRETRTSCSVVLWGRGACKPRRARSSRVALASISPHTLAPSAAWMLRTAGMLCTGSSHARERECYTVTEFSACPGASPSCRPSWPGSPRPPPRAASVDIESAPLEHCSHESETAGTHLGVDLRAPTRLVVALRRDVRALVPRLGLVLALLVKARRSSDLLEREMESEKERV